MTSYVKKKMVREITLQDNKVKANTPPQIASMLELMLPSCKMLSTESKFAAKKQTV